MSKLLANLVAERDEGIAKRVNPGFTLSIDELQDIIWHIKNLEDAVTEYRRHISSQRKASAALLIGQFMESMAEDT